MPPAQALPRHAVLRDAFDAAAFVAAMISYHISLIIILMLMQRARFYAPYSRL